MTKTAVHRALHGLAEYWRRLPAAGAAVVQLGAPPGRRLVCFAAEHHWQGVPRWRRTLLGSIDRISWLAACPLKTLLLHRSEYLPGALSVRGIAWAVWLGWTRGKAPFDTLALLATYPGERFIGDRRKRIIDGPDGRQSVLLLKALGDAGDHRLAADKCAMSHALGGIGVPAPPILAEVTAQSRLDLSASPWIERRRLFLKPRHGSGSRGVTVVERIASDRIRVAGEEIPLAEFPRWLADRAVGDSLLVQPFLEAHPAIADISSPAPPWLRITIFRSPHGEPRVLGGTLFVPRQHQGGDAPSILCIPVDPRDGTLLPGLVWERPQQRCDAIPWNGARLAGRAIWGWEEACRLTLRGSALLPHVPMIGWDVLLTRDGAIVSEANTEIAIASAEFFFLEANLPSPLTEVLLQWLAERQG